MSEARSKPDKSTPPLLPPMKRYAQIPESLGPKGPSAIVPRMPETLAKMTQARQRATAAHKFDKAFPVMLESVRGIANGVGRNISAEGMFVETRDPLPMGTQVRVIFGSRDSGTEISAIAEVRFQCFLNYSGDGGEQEGMRGMGVRFVKFEETESPPDKDSAN
jgi:hypothetical protein